jgi:hypothetical protein
MRRRWGFGKGDEDMERELRMRRSRLELGFSVR